MYHKIIPVYNGNLTVNFGPFSELPQVRATDFNIHSFIFLIIDEEGDAVVVDAGFDENQLFGLDSVSSRSPDEEIVKSIANHGYDASKIKNVIMTHIHWDHTGGMKYFTDATFHIQLSDFTELLNLEFHDETGYTPHHWLDCLPRVNLIDGTYELKPGIRLIHTGGHCPGHQVIEVNTKEGKVILAGDETIHHKKFWINMPEEFWNVFQSRYYEQFYWTHRNLPFIENWLAGRKSKIIQTGIMPKYSEIARMGDIILLSHDKNLFKIKSIPH